MQDKKYDFENDSSLLKPIKLLYVHQSQYSNDWNSLVHAHGFVEIFYITSGCGEFTIENQKYYVEKDNIIMVNHNTKHGEVSFEDSPLEYIVMGVDGISLSFADSLYHNEIIKDLYLTKKVRKYFDLLIEELEENTKNKEKVCTNIANAILAKLTLNSKNIEINRHKSMVSPEIMRVKNYIDDNFKDDIDLDKLATIAHINKFYLVHSFKKAFTLTPIQYLNKKKLEHCKDLIINTDYSILQISELCNFSSQSYFSQSFKKEYGMSPNQMKKKQA